MLLQLRLAIEDDEDANGELIVEFGVVHIPKTVEDGVSHLVDEDGVPTDDVGLNNCNLGGRCWS